MALYILRRLFHAVPTVLLVTILVFLMLHLAPGDPAVIFVGENQATPELLDKIREDMGLNRPLHVQYLSYIGNVLRGDFGRSLTTRRDVGREIMIRLPSTLELTIAAMLISVVLGISAGVIAALNHNTALDTAVMTLALVGISMPVFWSGLMLIVIFSVNLRWFPPIGQGSLDRLILPATALGLLSAGVIARLVRSSMLEVLNQDYIKTARAKGLRSPQVNLVHALRNALIPVITVLGLQFGQLLGGAVLTETIFARLGLGRMYAEGVLNKDFTLVQGTTLFIAVAYVVINIGVDIVYSLVDPRIRFD
jgi:peptide/nickel transport system permease protein